MFVSNKYCLIILSVLIILRCANAECRFEYQTDFPAIPSVLTDYGALLEPKNNAIILNSNQEVFVTCPGLNNVVDKFNYEYKLAFCVNGKTLSIMGKNYQFSELGCRKKVENNCYKETTTCGRGMGTFVGLGHNIANSFFPIFQVCYDYHNNIPLYAQQTIYGASIAYAKGSTSRPTFKEDCLPYTLNKAILDRAYLVASQLERFRKILYSEQLAKKYIIDKRSYLAKGHLNADSDQVLSTSTTATYFYINTLPMWQQVNNGNWKSLEISIRNYAKNTNQNLRILTGGHEILKLKNSQGIEKEIYLDDQNQIAVPKYLWKIIYSPETNEGMGFIALNNPFYEGSTMNICENICDSNRWGTNSWKEPKGGLLYCCSIQELARVIPQIPNLSYGNNMRNSFTNTFLDNQLPSYMTSYFLRQLLPRRLGYFL